jgi:hypothetical protein
MERLVGSTLILLESARLLGVPILVTEQYPKGLGPTVAPLAEKLRALGVEPIDKLTFDACGEPRVTRALAEHSPRAVVLAGMETHICVFQTARELVRRGLATRGEPRAGPQPVRARRRPRDPDGDRGVRLARPRRERRVQGDLEAGAVSLAAVCPPGG